MSEPLVVEQILPRAERVDLTTTLARLRAPAPAVPFNAEVISFCAELSNRLFRDREAAAFPELHALAFRMRQAELTRLADEFRALESPGHILVPRGLVFHVPPANVDTIFVYSWLMSVLTGNRNIVRLSPRVSPQTEIICRVFSEAASSAPDVVSQNTVMLRYGHEPEITQAISSACDTRMLWGGDRSVSTLRAFPISPRATELTFADRYSLSAIDAAAFDASDQAARARLAADFFNDLFWFDQMACSSPRLLVWCGSTAAVATASREFVEALAAHAASRGYSVQPQTRINRFSFACRAAIDGVAANYRDLRELIVLEVSDLAAFSREHCGGGLLFQYRAASLTDLAPFITNRDQTLTYFGIDGTDLETFARSVRGIDRIVPVGQALNFSRFWDGYDLFQELTRHVRIA